MEGFIRTKAYENAENLIDFVDNGYPKKKELIVNLKNSLYQNNWNIDHLKVYLSKQQESQKNTTINTWLNFLKKTFSSTNILVNKNTFRNFK